ncbi:hypothetical protein [Cytobacillus gottheilii]|uniref:hypothetical protein n=1 Tax=Cytobacillus gottheilii TaxID=859144 RepID=UPI0024958F03|nr:hypothetical protein [Cytobacillus gottheilii]
MIIILLWDLAKFLNINDGKDVYFSPIKDYFFQPLFQCCSRDEYIKIYGEPAPPSLYPNMGIYLPNVNIQVLYDDGQSTGFVDFVRDKLNENSIEKFSEVVYASFCLFHEEGHYNDFITSGFTVKEFIDRDSQERSSLEMQRQYIQTLPVEERELMSQLWYIQYFQLTAEKKANEYALNRMIENIEKILHFDNNY